MNCYPLKLYPAFKDYLWGGTKLHDFYPDCTANPAAEAWVLSCHKDGQSTVTNGPLAGKTLSEAVEAFGRDALGKRGKAFDFFPLLIKLIDAKKDLSVQVHPDDQYAEKNEHSYGKTEMWYVVDCNEGARLFYGFKQKISKEEFEQRIKDNTLTDALRSVEVKKGDCFSFPRAPFTPSEAECLLPKSSKIPTAPTAFMTTAVSVPTESRGSFTSKRLLMLQRPNRQNKSISAETTFLPTVNTSNRCFLRVRPTSR